MRPVRPLTLAAFGPAVVAVAALPFGFIEVAVAEVAGFIGLYFVIPAVIAWSLLAVRGRVPLALQRVLGVAILLLAIPVTAFWLLWMGPWFVLALPSAAVVFVVGVRLLQRSPA